MLFICSLTGLYAFVNEVNGFKIFLLKLYR